MPAQHCYTSYGTQRHPPGVRRSDQETGCAHWFPFTVVMTGHRPPKPCLPRHPGAVSRRSFLRTPLFLLPGTVSLFGQTRQEKGRQLLEDCLQALGGSRFLQVRNLVHNGRAYSFHRRNVRGLAKMTIYEHYGPVKEDAGPEWLPVRRREVYTEKGDYFTLFRDGEGWEVTFRGARPLPSERLARYRDSTRRDVFYFLRYRLNEPDMYFYYRGVEIIDNVPTDVVEVTDSNADGITLFLGRSDRLPVQQIHTWRDPQSGVPFEEKSVFSKYRAVRGVKVPWNIRSERDGEKRFELFGRSVEVDPRLDPGVYSLSKKVPILPEAP